ncbi:MAG: glycosyltransferase family 25 protein [Thiomonas sp.]|jgi:glycosyl transferase family 25|nr:glycosyltransferase family 25 protein [Betaproteobacteria bacterium]MDE2269192.1 glycosyltransferase family 25 protein [Betaproteobacteria bacterium]
MTNQKNARVKIWIVSLPDAHERRAHMRAQFAQFPGLVFEFFDAIRIKDRSQYPADYDTCARRLLFGDDLRPGEVGCFLSHRQLWERCAQSDDPAWVILEDDIVLHQAFQQRVGVLMQHAHEWDVVRLMQLLQRRGSWVHRRLDGVYTLRAYDRQPSGTQGYLLKPAVAQALCRHASKIVWPIDETLDLYWRHRQRLYTLEPAAIDVASEFESTIGTRSADLRPKWRKLQRQLINGFHGLQRRLYNLKLYGWGRGE